VATAVQAAPASKASLSIVFMGFPLPNAFRPKPDGSVERRPFPAFANSLTRELENTVT
jgi:hypothetical protein